ncbi:MAG: hypothetical protein CR988_04235 [Treponema sp.]|nr:MAG: hypothetical protein CR988_04235 [Treponema sp.]
MRGHTNTQIINGKNGKPAFAVIPYDIYQELYKQKDNEDNVYIPDDVVGRMIMAKNTPVQAWREYLGFTQIEIAKKLKISQAAYSQMETAKKPRKATLQKIAKALDIEFEQLDGMLPALRQAVIVLRQAQQPPAEGGGSGKTIALFKFLSNRGFRDEDSI